MDMNMQLDEHDESLKFSWQSVYVLHQLLFGQLRPELSSLSETWYPAPGTEDAPRKASMFDDTIKKGSTWPNTMYNTVYKAGD